MRTFLLIFVALGSATTALAQDPAPMPTGLWAAQTAATQVNLRWDSVPDVTEYRLYQRIGESDIKRIATAARNRNFWVVPLTGVSVGTRLQYQISAVHPKLGESAIVPFNAITIVAASLSTPAAPTGVAAALTDSNEVTLRWDAVPGATAYAIGRAVTPYGFMVLCATCATSNTYVDRAVTYGQAHTYTVEAITPGGRSRRATSNMVPVPRPGAAGLGGVASGVADIIRGMLGAPAPTLGTPRPPIMVSATVQAGTVKLEWQGFAADSPTAFLLERAINLGEFKSIASVAGDKAEYLDRALPQVYENGRMHVTYRINVRNRKGGSTLGATRSVTLENPSATSTPGFCTIEYRRANTMWADRGKPTPLPGLESLRLNAGNNRMFKTDWSYEGLRSSGGNYYGPHLRQLMNTGPREVVLYVRSLDPLVLVYTLNVDGPMRSLSEVVDLARQAINNTLSLTATKRHGLFAAEIKVRPGELIAVRADLLEVVCPKI